MRGEGRSEHQLQSSVTVPRIGLTSALPLLAFCHPSFLSLSDCFFYYCSVLPLFFPLSTTSLLCQPRPTHFQHTCKEDSWSGVHSCGSLSGCDFTVHQCPGGIALTSEALPPTAQLFLVISVTCSEILHSQSLLKV